MKIVLLAVLIIIGIAGSALLYVQLPKFGPSIDTSGFDAIPGLNNFANGRFQNLEPTPVIRDEQSTFSALWEARQRRSQYVTPDNAVPSVKTDLNSLDQEHNLVIWLGHSSYYIQLNGLRILLDPVFSTSAAPVPGVNKAYAGTSVYSAADMPMIDLLLITHDHWDHLDYPTIEALRPKVRKVISGYGIDQYFRDWGYDAGQLASGAWFSAFEQDNELTVYIVPARHYSGRLLSRQKTLWSGFVLETPDRRLLFSGDTGDGIHFDRIAERFGRFDVASLDMGQYDAQWPNIHMTPEQASEVARRLNVSTLMPAHVGKFTLSNHAWYEPFERIVDASEGASYQLLIPIMGEPVSLDGGQEYTLRPWWRSLQ